MAPRTAQEAAELLAQRGRHSHLSSEGYTVCVSHRCTPTPNVLGTSLLIPADTRPAGFKLTGDYL
ncbi:hypothetical protein AB0F46_21590 [Streptomyces sp. NPDC026665]|uniref:hypothetical protein n=1 Tax=Streptomyces sp. NPDC026665 TaxID=3154798 RepID=UPI0033DB07EB